MYLRLQCNAMCKLVYAFIVLVGVLSITAVAQDARGQARNRELALERLRRRLTDALTPRRHRQATRPTTASVERRLDVKRRQAARKRQRRRPGSDD